MIKLIKREKNYLKLQEKLLELVNLKKNNVLKILIDIIEKLKMKDYLNKVF